jgi:hypothetical protein
MPPNTVKVDRTTKWGNPFVVGEHGTQDECVQHYRALVTGVLLRSAGADHLRRQRDVRRQLEAAAVELRGKNLACWCRPGTPCHADVLLELANAKTGTRATKQGGRRGR